MIHPVPKPQPKAKRPRARLQQGKPIKRQGRLPPKRVKPRRSPRVRDTAYLVAVKELPCLLHFLRKCEGPTEADHAGRRPLGRKCSDHETIPLCRKHHRERTDMAGEFRRWGASILRAWLDVSITDTQRRLAQFIEKEAA